MNSLKSAKCFIFKLTMNFRLPGPTALHPHVLAAMQKSMIDHRGAESVRMVRRLVALYQQILGTTQDVYMMTSSGWGGVESLLVNTIAAGDRVLNVSAGFFGEKFGAMAQAFGAEVESLRFADGYIIEAQAVAAKLRSMSDVKAVLLTQNESYTGVLHPLGEIARAIRENSDALILVDAVSASGATETRMDEWGIDGLATASQKALMGPPGMGIFAVSERAWQAYARTKTPRVYFDWGPYKEHLNMGTVPSTAALPVLYALNAAADLIEAEGLANVYARHERIAAFTRACVAKMGLKVLSQPNAHSPALTAVLMPEGVNGDKVRATMNEMDVAVGGSWGRLQGKIIRIGHMGAVTEADIDDAMEVLGDAIAKNR